MATKRPAAKTLKNGINGEVLLRVPQMNVPSVQIDVIRNPITKAPSLNKTTVYIERLCFLLKKLQNYYLL